MGTVFRAFDRREGCVVALKILRGRDDVDVERFVREAAILAELDHPNIVRYADHGLTEAGEHYLAMEWLEGEDLAARIARRPLSDAETLTAMAQAAAAVAFAHAHGAVHRDIKPSNIFLRGHEVARACVLDFGIAGLSGDPHKLTQTGVLLGTPGYVAPEQVQGAPTYDPRSDVFSLGCVLFECLVGRPAFEGQTPLAVLAKLLLQESPRLRDARPGIAPPLDALVSRMLAKDPAARPQTLDEVATELRAIAAARPRGPRRRTHRRQRRRPLRRRSPVSERGLSLTRNELRLVTVVLAGRPEADAGPRSAGPDVALAAELAAACGAARRAPHAARRRVAHHHRLGAGHRGGPRRARRPLRAGGDGPLPGSLGGDRHRPRAGRRARGRGGRHRPRRARAGRDAPGQGADRRAHRGDAHRALRRGAGRQRLGPAPRRRPQGREAAPLLLGPATPCIGRNRELAMLEGIFSGCIAEPVASAVLITGPAGVGKSRLRRELVDKLRRRGEPLEVLSGRADALAAGAAFGTIASVVRAAAGIREGEPLERAARQAPRPASPAASRSPMLARVASFLGELISTPFPDGGDAVLVAARDNPLLMGDAMRAAWEEWLIAECAAQPVLLLLEDLHWGDAATVRLIDATLRNLREVALMVLAHARPEAQGDVLSAWTRRDVPVIKLGPLPARASERLVRDALGDGAEDALVRRVVEKGGGNPFYLGELVRAVAAGHGDGLPDSVLGIVEARLDAEGPEAKRILRAVSVFGDRFTVEGVAALLGGDRAVPDVRRALAALSSREIVAAGPGGAELVFCNSMVRDAAYAMLTEADRALGHRLAAAFMERTGHTDAMALAEHFRRGAEPERAARWYRRAAEKALEANDLAAALARAERGVGSGAQGEDLGVLRLVQAEAHVWRGDLEAAVTRGVDAIGLLGPGSVPWFRAVTWSPPPESWARSSASRAGRRPPPRPCRRRARGERRSPASASAPRSSGSAATTRRRTGRSPPSTAPRPPTPPRSTWSAARCSLGPAGSAPSTTAISAPAASTSRRRSPRSRPRAITATPAWCDRTWATCSPS